jgi:glutathione S-transferase
MTLPTYNAMPPLTPHKPTAQRATVSRWSHYQEGDADQAMHDVTVALHREAAGLNLATKFLNVATRLLIGVVATVLVAAAIVGLY